MRMVIFGLVVLAASGLAQPPGRPGRAGDFGPGAGRGQGPGPGGFGGARLVGMEAGMPGRVVKNSPYSAEIVTETTQVLQDGNRIRQSSTVKVYRDSEGRTRHEQSLKTLNGLAPNSNLPQVVFINDPVAGANYALNPEAKTATRSNWSRPGGGGGEPGGRMGRGPRPAPESAGGLQPQGRGPRRANPNVKTEALGTQMIEGVQAEGTRTTMTIAAGEIGNEQPIQMVTETWYSQELKATVLSKRTDPRMGETVTRMTNISRTEPSSTVFQVPVDFKVSEISRGRGPQQ